MTNEKARVMDLIEYMTAQHIEVLAQIMIAHGDCIGRERDERGLTLKFADGAEIRLDVFVVSYLPVEPVT